MSKTTFTPRIIARMVLFIVLTFFILVFGLISCLRYLHSKGASEEKEGARFAQTAEIPS